MTDLPPDFDSDTFELCCGGRKRCPIITKTAEGFELSDEGKVISMTDAQAAGLRSFIEAKIGPDPTG